MKQLSLIIYIVLTTQVWAEEVYKALSREVAAAVVSSSTDIVLVAEAEKISKQANHSNDLSSNCTTSQDFVSPSNTDDKGLFFESQYLALDSRPEYNGIGVKIPRVNLRDVISKEVELTEVDRSSLINLGNEGLVNLIKTHSELNGQELYDASYNALLIYELSKLQSESDIMNKLQSSMKDASFDKKVNFLANLLSYTKDNYDKELIENGQTEENRESTITMMAAINESIATGEIIPAGVCRHMHQMAVRFARAMGIKEAFGVGFETINGGHRTIVLTLPDDPTRVVQLNYGNRSSNVGVSGVAALAQGHKNPDVGIRFRIYNGNDRAAIQLPSELGGVLNKVTGGDDSDLSPAYVNNSTVQQIGINTPYGIFRLFKAQNQQGDNAETNGMAFNVNENYSDIFYMKIGAAAFLSRRAVQQGDLKNIGGYAQTTHGVKEVVLQSENVNVATFAQAHLRGSMSCAGVGNRECKKTKDFDISGQYGIKSDYDIGTVKNNTNLIGQVQIGIIRVNNDKPKPFTLLMPVTRLEHDSFFELSGSATFNLGGAINLYNLGTGIYGTYEVHSSIDSEDLGTLARLTSRGRMGNDTPFWLPGAERTVEGNINQSLFKDQLYFGINGQTSFDIKDGHFLGVSVGGTLN